MGDSPGPFSVTKEYQMRRCLLLSMLEPTLCHATDHNHAIPIVRGFVRALLCVLPVTLDPGPIW